MQDDPFPAAERILADIDAVFRKDPKLKEFDIVPVTVNNNKSPVLHVEHCLGLESWCVRHVYCYTYHRLMDARQSHSRREDPVTLARLLSGALLLNPDVSTFWNMRRELMQTGRLAVQGDLHFTAVLLSRKPKCAEAFAHRKWVVDKLLQDGADKEGLLEEELQVSQYAADRYPNNYHAWSHRMWCLIHLAPADSTVVLKEWTTSETWVSSHVSDHSGMQYRQFLLKRLLELKHLVCEEIVETAKKSIQQLLSSTNATLGNNQGDGDNMYCITRMSATMKSIGLIISELLFNMDLILRFTGHEALWCHRRYLLMSLKKFLICRGVDINGSCRFTKVSVVNNKCEQNLQNLSPISVGKCAEVALPYRMTCHIIGMEADVSSNADDIIPHSDKDSSHKNMDGVPLEKDQKLSSDNYISLDKHDRDLCCHLQGSFIFHEAKLINSCRPDELHQQRLAKQHQKWLSHILKFDIPSAVC